MTNGWRARVDALLAAAPEEMRALASAELHIGGMVNVRLAHPVLDVTGAADAEAAVVFFVAACVVHDVVLGRVMCASRSLATVVRERLGDVVERVDDECAALMGYFDVYLRRLAADDPAGETLADALAVALARR